jgi:membrane associated rhomboid family serine protease
MSETELRVICKNCGSEVSPYVTECPYCGARLRKRAPKLERRGDALEPKPRRRSPSRLIPRRLRRLRRGGAGGAERPYATLAVIAGSAALILVQKATGDPVSSFGGIAVPFEDDWWRYLTAPFAYVDVGYLFVVAVALAIFGVGLERRLGSAATAVLMIACGALGMLAASGIVNAQDEVDVIAGGNGLALGTVIAWLAVRRAEVGASIEQEYDRVGVAVAVVVLLALPIFESTANVFAGIVGGVVGGVAGIVAAALRPSE